MTSGPPPKDHTVPFSLPTHANGILPDRMIAAMADEKRGFYAVQFHPEVTHTRQGAKILQRFVREICA